LATTQALTTPKKFLQLFISDPELSCHSAYIYCFFEAIISVRIRIRFSVWLVSCYAHVFVRL